MLLTSRASSSFLPVVARRGRAYFLDGAVHLENAANPECIVATVQGSDVYYVVLNVRRKRTAWTISAACTCPYVEQNYLCCKHIFATLLAVEERGVLGPPPADVSVELNADDGYSGRSDDFDVDESDSIRTPSRRTRKRRHGSAGARHRRDAARPPRVRAAAPTWNALIRKLSHLAGSNPVTMNAMDRLEPLYVLDPDESGARSSMVIHLMHRERLRSGEFGKPKKLRMTSNMIPALASELDRRICLMLIGARLTADDAYDAGYGYSFSASLYADSYSSVTIGPDTRNILLPLLNDTGRFLLSHGRDADAVPLRWNSAPWNAVIRLQPAGRGHFQLAALLARDGVCRPAAEAVRIFCDEPGHVLFGDELSPLNLNGSRAWLPELVEMPPLKIADSDAPRLLADLARMPVVPPIEWPETWNVQVQTDVAPRPRVELTMASDDEHHRSRHARADIRFCYGLRDVRAGSASTTIIDPDERQQIVRRFDVEAAHLHRIRELGFEQNPYGLDYYRILTSRVPDVVCRLLAEDWEVTGNKTLFRRPGTFHIEATSGIDWFEIRGGVDFDGVAAGLPDLLAAWRRGETFVKLGDGTMGMLPQEWLRRHGALLELGDAKKNAVRFARSQIGVVDALLAELPEASFDQTVTRARKKLAGFAGIKPRPAPRQFNGTLRPYQEQGLGWLGFLADFELGGCLADDMGLGKTVQMLARLAEVHRPKAGPPSLVVVPKSLIFNWLREAERFAPGLRVVDYTGLERSDARCRLNDCDVVITTYGTLRRDIELLAKRDFNYVILDEAQAIKNPNAQSRKAAKLLRGRQRIAMTGTPVENSLTDLWSIVDFLNPGMLGDVARFRASFANGAGGDTQERNLLHRILRPIILRRTKEQVAPELPPRTEQTVDCVLDSRQRRLYDELRDHYRASILKQVDEGGMNRARMHVLEALLRLRQAACHPALVDKSKSRVESAKLNTLLSMLDELHDEGHKGLVFSQFTSMLALVRQALDGRGLVYEYLDGKTRDRAARVDRFQSDDKCGLFLISLKAGGTGLNLTAADYVFILDPWWNPAVEAQAIDRTHRIGQDKHVIAYRLIAKDTVESRILELQQRKRDLAASIVTEDNSLLSGLTREDLVLLLS